jgi:hypothetical protein
VKEKHIWKARAIVLQWDCGKEKEHILKSMLVSKMSYMSRKGEYHSLVLPMKEIKSKKTDDVWKELELLMDNFDSNLLWGD